ncbi:NUDIX hydrolase [Plebeiibacterium sediminum]|uniref:NUDIX domain-containing protein n=1 Tax=Plebeiibacterium sediminum TaxID=2992112 RepID=A0AAE3SF65_9BACT|nr:NUDIX domain-containing protein [Plebeiobacterium sediminum]MCW3785853.1 NUDIX domain-containing protein [Plebeiobacterium sediminum]
MKLTEDRYQGITIDPDSLPESTDEFQKEIATLIPNLNGSKLLWVKIPIEKSDFIPVLTKLDFQFHHCKEDYLMLVKKLVENPIVPTAKNYTVGVGAIIRDGNNLLVVKDKFNTGYKLPGGHVDNNEALKEALKREVFEETGIHAEFESILNLGHFTKGQFEESIIYIVCTAKALTKEISIYDDSEIIEARWIDVEEFLRLEDTNTYNKNVVLASVNNKDLKLTEQPIKLTVSGAEVFY